MKTYKVYTDGKTVVFFKQCLISKKLYEVEVPKVQVDAWRNGKMIQDAMPELSADQREFVLSGITPDEWAATFED